ncbi:MAG: hypothetical protein AAGD38_15830, partial [Acidobacteriota bacterium]
LDATGGWPSRSEILRRFERRRRREVVVLVGDLHPMTSQRGESKDESDEQRSLLAALRALGHEVWIAHLVGRREIDLDYRGDVIFVDHESAATIRANADALQAAYRHARTVDDRAWRQTLGELGIVRDEIVIDRPLEYALRAFLLDRRRSS